MVRIALLALLLCGCASKGNWTVVVVPHGVHHSDPYQIYKAAKRDESNTPLR